MIAGGRPDLRRILLAYTVNQLGTWFGYIALAVAVYDHTHSAIAVAGLFVAARVLPALVVPALTARVEVSTRRGALSGLYFVEAGAAVALALLIDKLWLPGVLLLVAIDGTAALTANALLRATASRAGSASSNAEREERGRRANAALNVAFSASVAIGPAIAGLFVSMAGASSALGIDAGSFAVCGTLLIALRSQSDDVGVVGVMERLRDAWRYARSVPELGYLLVVQGAALIFFTSVEPIEVLYAKSTLNVGDAGYGAIAGAWGVGMVIGSLLFSRWIRRPLGPQLLGGTLTIGLAYLGFAAAPTLGVACLVAIAGGAGNGLQWVAAISAMQRLTPDRLYARLMGAVESIGSISPAIGFSLGGLLTAVSDPRVAFLVAGSGAIVMTFAFVRIVRRGVGGTTSGRTPTDGAHIPSVAPPAGARVSAGKAPG